MKSHKDLQRCYKYTIYVAQKKRWEDYCEGIESYPEAASLNQILAGKPGAWLKAVRLTNGEYAESAEECLKLLHETHYSGFREEEKEETRPRNKSKRDMKTSWEMARKIFTLERVKWAIANLARYEAHEVDGIYPVPLQDGIKLLIVRAGYHTYRYIKARE